jgi:hypothetical protein
MKKRIFKVQRTAVVKVAQIIGKRMSEGKATRQEEEIRKQLMNWTTRKTRELYN